MKLNIKLEEAKRAIAIHDFKREDLLIIALTEPSDLNNPYLFSTSERIEREKIYRRLAFLGDALLDSVLADYLFNLDKNLSKKDLDDCRQEILSKNSLTEFATDLGLPNFSSSWQQKNRLSPEKQPRLWAEMFEVFVGVIFIDRQKNFLHLSQWLIDNFIRTAVGIYLNDPDYNGMITSEEYAEMIGLPYYWGWLPGDDDN